MNNPPHPGISVIIAAAGQSSRMNLKNGASKQFIEIAEKSVLRRTLEVFDASPYTSEIIISARESDIDKVKKISKDCNKIKTITAGGATRFESVKKAAGYIPPGSDYIAVHDGARCFVSLGDIEKVALKAFETGAAAAGYKITDTVKRVESGVITHTFERKFLYAVQTPQIFLKEHYLKALESANGDEPDDCCILERAGYKVFVVECSRYNIKITDELDLEFFSRN
ncbi:MAG: 2-C-methyl-D-erythritol 4-phosphate cytidylyltransferase [Oscillospiraceae bacterium]|nr:2-C-methyl-D-erythritol 4-phosphate cytidylyltransferase [Oscillospiraceae bacterium]